MKIVVIGCGSAFSNKNFNQSFLLEEEDQRMLIDCGRNIPEALHQAKISYKSINNIYISHLHGDHVGGLEFLALKRYDWVNKPIKAKIAPKLIANEKLLIDLWNNTLKGGLETMEGFVANMNTFFHPFPIQPNQSFKFHTWKITLVQQIHVMSGSVITPSFGLFIEKSGHKSVYFTIDAQYFQPKQVKVFYEKADIIFQDCECTGVDMKKKEYIFGSGVHASYAELAGFPSANATVLPDNYKNKIILSHYQDFVIDGKDFFGNDCNWEEEAKNAGFMGLARVGQVIEI